MRLTGSKNVLHFGIKCSKSLRFRGLRPRSRLGAHDAPPDPLVARGFLPSAIAASRLRRLHFSQFFQYLSPQSFQYLSLRSYVQIYASVYGPPYLFSCNSTTGSRGKEGSRNIFWKTKNKKITGARGERKSTEKAQVT